MNCRLVNVIEAIRIWSALFWLPEAEVVCLLGSRHIYHKVLKHPQKNQSILKMKYLIISDC